MSKQFLNRGEMPLKNRLMWQAVTLLMAFFAVFSVLIPLSNYIEWRNYFGIAVWVVVVWLPVRGMVPQIREVFSSFPKFKFFVLFVVLAEMIFFISSHGTDFAGRKNTITVYPKERHFAIVGFEFQGENNRLPATGYTQTDSDGSWKLARNQMMVQQKSAEESVPIEFELATEFIRKNKLRLELRCVTAGAVKLEVNGKEELVPVNSPGNIMVDLSTLNLRPERNRALFFPLAICGVGTMCIALFLYCYILKIKEIIAEGGNVAIHGIFVICLLFPVWAAPYIMLGTNCSDLSRIEPGMPYEYFWEISKHPPYVQTCWGLVCLLIPVKSCFTAFTVGMLMVYLASLLMIEQFLCRLKSRWVAWAVLLVCLSNLRLYDGRFMVYVDAFMVNAAFLAAGCFAMIITAADRLKRALLFVLFAFAIYTTISVRHEAVVVAFGITMGLCGVLLKKPRNAFWRMVCAGALSAVVCLTVFFCNEHLIFKYLYGYKSEDVAKVKALEIRRYKITEILNICFYSKNWDILPPDAKKCLDRSVEYGKFSLKQPPPTPLPGNYIQESFEPISDERLDEIWKGMIKAHPKVYIYGKWYRYMFMRENRYKAVLPPSPKKFGEGWVSAFYDPLGFVLTMPWWTVWLTPLLAIVVALVAMCRRGGFTGVAWFVLALATSDLLHQLSFVIIPVSPYPFRYLFWAYCSSGILFFLLLYLGGKLTVEIVAKRVEEDVYN